MMQIINKLNSIFLFLIIFTATINGYSQDQTVGLFLNEAEAYEGYTLFTPNVSTKTYLIDMNGLLVHKWEHEYTPSQSVYLLDNGNILRATSIPSGASSSAGGFQEVAWDGTIIWEYNFDEQHHDIEPLPNGNVLIIANETKTRAEVIEAGRDPDLLGTNLQITVLFEIANTDTGSAIVWEWHLWDHLIQDFDPDKNNYGNVGQHPELMDINYMERLGSDWNHTNSVDYNTEFDQIVLSNRALNDIWVIDHSTTTSEAAGHSGGNSGMGGDILYRWGNPVSYRAGDNDDQMLFEQHDASWIESGNPGSGNILIFNNGLGRPEGAYSTVDEITPPVDSFGNYSLQIGSAFAPISQSWIYQASNPTDFYSARYSGAQRLPNGNTLICSGVGGKFFEVTAANNIVWEYINPVDSDEPVYQGESVSNNDVYRCYRYAADHPGLVGKDLTPGDPIELYPSSLESMKHKEIQNFALYNNYPNPFNPSTVIEYRLSVSSNVILDISNSRGQKIITLVNKNQKAGIYQVTFNATDVSSGIYFYRLNTGNGIVLTKKMLVLK